MTWYNLDPFLPIAELKELHLEICKGISKSIQEIGTYGPGLYDPTLTNIKDVSQEIETIKADKNYEEIISDMSYQELKEFVRLVTKAKTLGRIIYLKQSDHYRYIQDDKHSHLTENAQYFPGLMNLIENFPFKETGRIIIFLSDAYAPGLIHSDIKKSNFIWMRTEFHKQFFIYDPVTSEKEYVTSHSALFNCADFHGYDPSPHSSFSIRIDGHFTEKFKKQIGL